LRRKWPSRGCIANCDDEISPSHVDLWQSLSSRRG
jgi:hypothetical protein